MPDKTQTANKMLFYSPTESVNRSLFYSPTESANDGCDRQSWHPALTFSRAYAISFESANSSRRLSLAQTQSVNKILFYSPTESVNKIIL